VVTTNYENLSSVLGNRFDIFLAESHGVVDDHRRNWNISYIHNVVLRDIFVLLRMVVVLAEMADVTYSCRAFSLASSERNTDIEWNSNDSDVKFGSVYVLGSSIVNMRSSEERLHA
jgi:hypothetical protein